MEKIISDLSKLISFKETTEINDVVLVAAKEPQMIVYGVVSDIVRDVSKKDEWYHVHMNILSVPPQKVVWTLRPEQMTGREIFTMSGDPRFLKALDMSGTVEGAQKDSPPDDHKAAHLRLVK